jgi:hypothetical protein
MPTLRQKVDAFCTAAGTTNASSTRIAKLEDALKKAKNEMAEHKKNMKYQQAQTRKAAKAPKSPKAPKAPKVKQEVSMNPIPAEETAEQRSRRLEGEMGPGGYALAGKGGRRTRRRRRY